MIANCLDRLWLVFFLAGGLVYSSLQPAYGQEEEQADTTVVDIDSIQVGNSNNIGIGQPGTENASDSVIVVDDDRNKAPKKAALLSAAFPGLGQIYNGKYWKAPIIYAGFAGLAYAVVWNNDKYQLFRRVFLARQARIPVPAENPLNGLPLGDADLTQLENFVNNFRRDRDYIIILMVGLYGLQIMDAIVDAHLMDFDTDKNLSFEIKPSGSNGGLEHGFSVPNYGIALTLRFH